MNWSHVKTIVAAILIRDFIIYILVVGTFTVIVKFIS